MIRRDLPGTIYTNRGSNPKLKLRHLPIWIPMEYRDGHGAIRKDSIQRERSNSADRFGNLLLAEYQSAMQTQSPKVM
ncbi:MAG: hypothetical protein KGQ60_03265 [Planctomycetes bacterium]|nr:hypothetical protein [Planctomycetota bacterium]